MKSIIALGVGLVVALAPGTAFADPAAEEFGTGKGKAYGNCQHSSATGSHEPLDGGAGKGNGGHVQAAKELQASGKEAFGAACKPAPEVVVAPAPVVLAVEEEPYFAGAEEPIT